MAKMEISSTWYFQRTSTWNNLGGKFIGDLDLPREKRPKRGAKKKNSPLSILYSDTPPGGVRG